MYFNLIINDSKRAYVAHVLAKGYKSLTSAWLISCVWYPESLLWFDMTGTNRMAHKETDKDGLYVWYFSAPQLSGQSVLSSLFILCLEQAPIRQCTRLQNNNWVILYVIVIFKYNQVKCKPLTHMEIRIAWKKKQVGRWGNETCHTSVAHVTTNVIWVSFVMPHIWLLLYCGPLRFVFVFVYPWIHTCCANDIPFE